MKLLLLGANGRTGQHVLDDALEAGLHVTAVVRDASKRPDVTHEHLRVLVGDPCDATFLAGAMAGQDALISTLGGRMPSKAATSVYYRSAEAIVAAAQETGLQRVLVTSTALLFEEQTLMGEVLRFVVPNVTRSAAKMEEILAQSGLRWTSARTGFLTDEDAHKYRAKKGDLPDEGTSVSRRALARFLLDAVDNPNAFGAAYGVSQGKG